MPTQSQSDSDLLNKKNQSAETELKKLSQELKKQRKQNALTTDSIEAMQSGIKSALNKVDMNSSSAMKGALASLKAVKKEAEKIADDSWAGKKDYLKALDASIQTYEANTVSITKMAKNMFSSIPSVKDLAGTTLKAAFPLLGAVSKVVSDIRKKDEDTKKALVDAISPLQEETKKTRESQEEAQKQTEVENKKAKNPKNKRDAPLVSRMEALRVQATIQTKLLEALYKVWDGDVTDIAGLASELEVANEQVKKFNDTSLKIDTESSDNLNLLVKQNDKLLDNAEDAARNAQKLALQQLEAQKEANAKKLEVPTLQKADSQKGGEGIFGSLFMGITGFILKIKTLGNLLSKEGLIGKLFSKIPFIDDLAKVFSKTGTIRKSVAKITGLFSEAGVVGSILSKIGSVGGIFGKLGGVLSPILKVFSGLSGILRGGLAAGKAVPVIGWVITAVFAIFDFFRGFSKEDTKKKLGKDKVDFRDRLSSGIGAVLGGIVGIVDEVAGWFGLDTKFNGKTIGQWVDWGVTNLLSIILHPIDSIKKLWEKIKAIDYSDMINKMFNAILHPFDTLVKTVDSVFGTDIEGFVTDIAKQITDGIFGLWESIKSSFLNGIKTLANFYIDNAPDAIIPDSMYEFAGRNKDGTYKVEPVKKTNELVAMENKQAKESAQKWVNQNMTTIAAPVTNNVNTSNATFTSGTLSTRNDDRSFIKSNLYYSPSDSW